MSLKVIQWSSSISRDDASRLEKTMARMLGVENGKLPNVGIPRFSSINLVYMTHLCSLEAPSKFRPQKSTMTVPDEAIQGVFVLIVWISRAKVVSS